MVLTSAGRAQERQFSFSLNNDIWNKTDRYYSNGFHASFTNPRFIIPLMALDSVQLKTAGVNLFQDVYTPAVYNTNVYDPFDRPYAAVLAAEYFLAFQKKQQAFKPSMLIGVIGKAALGQEVQNGVHEVIDNLEALGWGYQLKNGFLINVGLNYQYALIQLPLQQFSVIGNVNAGTYRNNVELGAQYQIGNRTMLQPKGILSLSGNWSHSVMAEAKIRAVGYDATLQGAWGQNYTYGIPNDRINRLPFIGAIGYTVRYKNIQFALEQNFQSAEFDGAENHRWLGLTIAGYF
jgi:hypothetical protein